MDVSDTRLGIQTMRVMCDTWQIVGCWLASTLRDVKLAHVVSVLCHSLHTLNLAGCDALSDVSALGQCSSLHTLNLAVCRQLSDVSALG